VNTDDGALIERAWRLISAARPPAHVAVPSWTQRRHTLRVRAEALAAGDVEIGQRTADAWMAESLGLLRETTNGPVNYRELGQWGIERRAVMEAMESRRARWRADPVTLSAGKRLAPQTRARHRSGPTGARAELWE
jgi:hypothetical protein